MEDRYSESLSNPSSLSLVNFPSVSAILHMLSHMFQRSQMFVSKRNREPHIETVVQTGRGLNPRGHSTTNHGNKEEDRVAKDDHLVVRLMAKLQHLLHLPYGIANKGLHILRRERHGQQSICDVAHIQVITSRRQSPTLLGHQAPYEADPKHASTNTGCNSPGYCRPILLSQPGPRRAPIFPSSAASGYTPRPRSRLTPSSCLFFFFFVFWSLLPGLVPSLSHATTLLPAAGTSLQLPIFLLLHSSSFSSCCSSSSTFRCIVAFNPPPSLASSTAAIRPQRHLVFCFAPQLLRKSAVLDRCKRDRFLLLPRNHSLNPRSLLFNPLINPSL